MKIAFLCLMMWWLFLGGNADAQDARPPFLKVEHIGIKEGLPNREINLITQDKQGFFWLSSRTGVYRYDGYQFIHLRKLAKNGRLVPSSKTQIFCLPDGDLLFLVDDAQFFLYHTLENDITLHPIHQLLGRKVLSLCHACVFVEKDGSIIFEQRLDGRQYLMRFREKDGLQTIDSHPYFMDDNSFILKDPEGNLFWGTAANGIRRYDPQGKIADSLLILSNNHQGHPVYLNEFFLDAFGRLFFGRLKMENLTLWDWQTSSVVPTSLKIDQYFPHSIALNNANTWLLELKKLWLLDSTNYMHDLTGFLTQQARFEVLRTVFIDAQNLIWVTTDNGIFRISISSGQFTRFMSSPQPKWAKTTRGFFEDQNGSVYFRCENCGNQSHNSIFTINPATHEISPVYFSCENEPADGVFIWVKRFYRMRGKNIVWTVGKNGLIKLDLTARTVRIQPGIDATLVNNPASVVASGMTRKGEILAGGKLSQLFVFDPSTEKFRFLIPHGLKSEQDGYLTSIIEASDGTIWVGLHRGLHRIDPEKGQILQTYGIETHPAFLSQEIQFIFEDKDSTIWVAGYGGGIVHVFPKSGRAEGFSTAHGLPDEIVADILPFGKDFLWISTFNGLSCFNKREKTFLNFFEEDGLSHNEFNFTSAFVDSKGWYYFGGMNGINAFLPEEILKPEKVSLPLLLTGFSYYDEKKDTLIEKFSGLQSLHEVTFSPYVSWFQFNYALASYTNPKFNQFKTWLEGFERGWTYQGATPFSRYNRLPPGHYVLHIKAADSKGYWSPSELAIQITVRQIFYKTWWFALVIGLFAASAIYMVARMRFRQKLQLERMRTRIASDLHDEVGSSLSHLNLLIGSFDVYNSPEQTALSANKAIQVMARTASNIRDVVWAIDARHDKTGDLLDRMEDFAFDMFSRKGIIYQFHATGIQREGWLNPFLRQNIYLIYKEAVHNIVKHSNATQVDIHLKQQGNGLVLKIADNGSIVRQNKLKGQGLENMQLRTNRIKGQLKVEQSEEGFVINLEIPLTST